MCWRPSFFLRPGHMHCAALLLSAHCRAKRPTSLPPVHAVDTVKRSFRSFGSLDRMGRWTLKLSEWKKTRCASACFWVLFARSPVLYPCPSPYSRAPQSIHGNGLKLLPCVPARVVFSVDDMPCALPVCGVLPCSSLLALTPLPPPPASRLHRKYPLKRKKVNPAEDFLQGRATTKLPQ